MGLREYFTGPRILAVALIAGPAVSGLVESLSGGDFVDGVRRVTGAGQGSLYMLAAIGAVALSKMYRCTPLNDAAKAESGR